MHAYMSPLGSFSFLKDESCYEGLWIGELEGMSGRGAWIIWGPSPLWQRSCQDLSGCILLIVSRFLQKSTKVLLARVLKVIFWLTSACTTSTGSPSFKQARVPPYGSSDTAAQVRPMYGSTTHCSTLNFVLNDLRELALRHHDMLVEPWLLNAWTYVCTIWAQSLLTTKKGLRPKLFGFDRTYSSMSFR